MGARKLFQGRYLELCASLVKDAHLFGLPFHESDLLLIGSRAEREGDAFILTILPQFGRHVEKAVISGNFPVTNLFLRKKPSVLPYFLYSLLSRVFKDTGELRVDACQLTIQFLRQFLLFNSKLEVAENWDSDAIVDVFREQQAALKVDWSNIDPSIIDEAQLLIEKMFRRANNRELLTGHHGPGATYEKASKTQKWDFETWPREADHEFPYLLYGRPNARINPFDKGVPLVSSETRIALVPKDFRGPRLISIEPTAMQFLQQGLWRELNHVIQTCALNASVRLEDQTFSRHYASKAISNDLATVDLSSASDHVSASLVWKLFSRVPILRRRLFSLRSRFARFGTKRIRLTCFAPMGSALCFPIETIVFTALSYAVMRVKNPSGSIRSLLSLIRVYGDDIVIPTAFVNDLVILLNSCGMSVNTQKTCYMTPFRECCGGEWFNDQDITIVRNKSYVYSEKHSFLNHSDLCGLQRRFYRRGYHATSDLLSSWANNIHPTATIEDVNGYDYESTLLGPIFSMGSARYRFNKSYQRFEVQVPVDCQRQEYWKGSEIGRLHAGLHSLSFDTVPIRSLRKKVRLGWRYVPCYKGISTFIQA